jgi:hypothetical protein
VKTQPWFRDDLFYVKAFGFVSRGKIMPFSARFTSVIVLSCFICTSLSYAHNALLFVEDNGDGTIYIEAGSSTGGPAGDARVIVRDKETNQPLSSFSMPDSGKINVPTPKVPYLVTLDMGSGHVVTRTGPFKGENENRGAGMQAHPKQAQDGTTAATRVLPLAAAGFLICITVILLIVSARIRKKNDEFLKRRDRP